MADLNNVRSNDGGIYLLVADETDEFEVAIHYAAKLTKANRARIGVLYVVDREEFQHWGRVAEKMHWEYRDRAEKLLHNTSQKIYDLSGMIPSLYLEEGGRLEVIIDVINRDLDIKKLILGGGTGSSNPGPLVSYFTGKGLPNLRVPLTIVPGNIALEAIEDLI